MAYPRRHFTEAEKQAVTEGRAAQTPVRALALSVGMHVPRLYACMRELKLPMRPDRRRAAPGRTGTA